MMTMSAVEGEEGRLPWRPQRWSCLREGGGGGGGEGGGGGGILESPLVAPMSWGGDIYHPLVESHLCCCRRHLLSIWNVSWVCIP